MHSLPRSHERRLLRTRGIRLEIFLATARKTRLVSVEASRRDISLMLDMYGGVNLTC